MEDNASGPVPGIDRRRLIGWGGLAVGAAAVGVPLVGTGTATAAPAPAGPDDRIPPDTRPGGAYDRYVEALAAEDRFSGVIMLAHRGRTVLSRSYGMADEEKGIANHEGVAFNLGSAIKPFVSVAVLQLVQQGRLRLSDLLGTHLTGFATDIAERVRIHHLLTNPGLGELEYEQQRVFEGVDEVHEFYEEWTRRARLVAAPGSDDGTDQGAVEILAQVVEEVTGTRFWDYAHEHVFGRAGMTGSAYYTRPQWLTDEHIAHSYMQQADGSRVDAVRNLDKGSANPFILGKNPARNFIDGAGDGGFATAPDLVRFARALHDGTLLDRPHADLLTGAKYPNFKPKAGQAPLPPDAPQGYTTYGPVSRS
jgi:CubicO group peptidase (beta-lactamase class C family)